MNGTRLLCRCLHGLDVRHVFGLPGTQNADFFSVLGECGIRPVVATDETSASFMANGYARASRRVGVLATIPGPGFAHALPGIAEARLDSIPLLLLVGMPSTEGGSRFQHQRIDQAAIARPIVKEVVSVTDVGEIGERLRRAYAIAREGEPGPVLLHLDPGVLKARAAPGEPVDHPDVSAASPASAEGSPWADDLRSRLSGARKPLVFVGHGALDASQAVGRLVERLGAPLFTTVSGRGILPEDHPNALCFDPDRGRVAELNELLDQADLILALGCKLSHSGTAGFQLRLPPERLVHVNTDPLALGPNYPADLEIQASVGTVVDLLLQAPRCGENSTWSRSEVQDWKRRISVPVEEAEEPRFHGVPDGAPARFFEALRSVLPRDGILVTDAGLHQVMTRRYFTVLRPGGLLLPTDFQSMGYGLSAALGARLAAPSVPVVAVIGDGGFLMSGMQLLCAKREGLSIVVVVLNDGFLNLIRLQQLRSGGRSAAVEVPSPDLEGFARSMNASYRFVDGSPEETLRSALQEEGPSLVEVRLGDSAGIRRLRRRGAVRHLARRTLGQRVIDRLKKLLGR